MSEDPSELHAKTPKALYSWPSACLLELLGDNVRISGAASYCASTIVIGWDVSSSLFF